MRSEEDRISGKDITEQKILSKRSENGSHIPMTRSSWSKIFSLLYNQAQVDIA